MLVILTSAFLFDHESSSGITVKMERRVMNQPTTRLQKEVHAAK